MMEMSPSPGSFFDDDQIEREWKGTGGKLKKYGSENNSRRAKTKHERNYNDKRV